MSEGRQDIHPIAITQEQYSLLLNYRAARERENQATDESTKQATDIGILTVLGEMYKNRFPDWLPVTSLGRKTNDSAVILEASASTQLPTNTTSVAAPAGNHLEQSFQEPSPLDPEATSQCTEALKLGFPTESNNSESGAVSDPVVQSSSMPVPPSGYQLPLFDAETTNQCAEALPNALPGESNNSACVVRDPTVQLCAMLAPLSDYELSLFNPDTANPCAEALTNGFLAEAESNVAQSSMSAPVPISQSESYDPLHSQFEALDNIYAQFPLNYSIHT